MNPARAAFLLFLVMLFLSATAAVPRLLTVQGRLKEAGSAVSGNYDITFYIYNTESGGSPLYTEAHTGANAVPVSAGFFSVVLGEITPLDLPFKEQYWLALKVGSDAEMAPRIKLTNSSYAFVARDLNVASNLNIDSGTLYVDIGNNRVGIGTTSPSYKLQVEDAGNTVELKVVADSTHPAILSAVGGTSGTLELRDLGGGADATRKLIRSDGGKLYFYKTDDAWGVETAQMVIDNSGNVGIGTTSPAELLHVGTGAHGDVIQIGSYTALGEDYSSAATILGDNVKPIGYGTSGMEIITTHSSCGARAIQMRSGQGITFHTLSGSVTAGDTFSSERMRITDTGNVGIGTTNPTYDLHVTGSDEPVAMVNIDTGSTNSMVSALLLQADTSGNMANGFGPNLWFSIKDVVPSSIAKIGAVRDGADSSGMLKFGTYNSGSYNTNMVIDHSGNVGIGTTSPGQLLELQKNSEGNLIYGLKLVNNGASTDTVNTATGILFGTGYSAQTSTRGKGALVYATTGGYNVGDFHFLQNSVADGSIATLSDSVMTIKNNGNVGIGTTSPGAKLEVNGQVLIAGKYPISGSGATINYTAPDGTQYSLDTSTCAADAWCCTADWGICFYKYSSGGDSKVQFTLKDSHSIACTFLHNEDDSPRPGFYFATDSGNGCYGDYSCFILRREGDSGQIIANYASYYILCF